MPRFFSYDCGNDNFILSGEDGRHIARSLRMKAGEALTVCDGKCTDYECEIASISGDEVSLNVTEVHPSKGEADVQITVYQSVPKGDKMDGIVQRAVELGAVKIVPVLSERCVSRPDAKGQKAKLTRWRKIALESAMQCGRGIIPEVADFVDFQTAVNNTKCDKLILFYEGGGAPIGSMGIKCKTAISLFIGPEGGFEESEVETAKSAGALIGSLGPRILRTQTASLAATAAIMFLTGNMD